MPRLILERRRDKQEYTDKFLIVSSADGPRGHRSRKVPLSKLFPSICPTECASGSSVINTPHSQKFLKREYSKGSQSSKPLLRGPDHQYSQKRQKFAEPRIPRVPPGREPPRPRAPRAALSLLLRVEKLYTSRVNTVHTNTNQVQVHGAWPVTL